MRGVEYREIRTCFVAQVVAADRRLRRARLSQPLQIRLAAPAVRPDDRGGHFRQQRHIPRSRRVPRRPGQEDPPARSQRVNK